MVNGKMNLRNSRSNGERLFMWRIAMNLSQTQAAKKLGLTHKQYWKAENDSKTYPIKVTNHKPENRAMLCRLARRRHGTSLLGTARLLGISHTTLLQREKIGDPDLVSAWQELGYRF